MEELNCRGVAYLQACCFEKRLDNSFENPCVIKIERLSCCARSFQRIEMYQRRKRGGHGVSYLDAESRDCQERDKMERKTAAEDEKECSVRICVETKHVYYHIIIACQDKGRGLIFFKHISICVRSSETLNKSSVYWLKIWRLKIVRFSTDLCRWSKFL